MTSPQRALGVARDSVWPVTISPDRRLTVEVEDGALPCQLFLPAAGAGPGILLLQEIFGVTAYLQSRARDLAGLGYCVLVPESYWRLGSPVIAEGADGLPEAMAATGRLDWDQTVGDAVAATRALRSRPEVVGPTGLMGFCFGGGLAWATAARLSAEGDGPDALVAYYGSQIPGLLKLAELITCPQLQHWGDADQYISADEVAAVEATATSGQHDVTFLRYQDAGHAFDNPAPVFHNEAASAQAWAETTTWLTQHLPKPIL